MRITRKCRECPESEIGSSLAEMRAERLLDHAVG
jgi:hypothetical protein